LLRAFDKYGDTWNPKNAIHLWLNLYNGHYLINGNKRLAFWFYNLAIQYYQYEDNFDWDGVYKELENE
jgi:prophage maintenance system killer protein